MKIIEKSCSSFFHISSQFHWATGVVLLPSHGFCFKSGSCKNSFHYITALNFDIKINISVYLVSPNHKIIVNRLSNNNFASLPLLKVDLLHS